MCRKYLIIVAVLLLNSNLIAQSIINLSSPEGGDKEHVANELIHFQPGYYYKAITSNDLMHAFIHPDAVGQISYNTGDINEDITTRSLNTDLFVGYTKGSLNVSSTGGGAYTIAIQLPKGSNSHMPSISVNYSSQSGNGLLGLGWSLTGISSIVRTGQSYYYDNNKKGVNYTNEDRFVLDGQRLLAQGDNGKNGTVYLTESENFNKVTSYGSLNGGPEKFILELKNGTKIHYGNTSQSRLTGSDNITAIVWNISKVVDINGNYYEYIYLLDDKELRLNEIKYTGNENSNSKLPYNSIKFKYQKRSDVQKYFSNGKEFKRGVLLSQIQIYNENVLFKSYEFKYKYDLYSYLSEIIEYGKDGKRYNPTIFQYGENVKIGGRILDLEVPDKNTPNFTYIPGDYDGDGHSDLMRFNYSTNNGVRYYTHADLLLNAREDNTRFIYEESVFFDSGFTLEKSSPFVALNNIGNLIGGDFNGDARKDFIMVKKSISGNSGTLQKIRVYSTEGNDITGYNFVHTDYDFTNYPFNKFYALAPYFVSVGDFTGNGTTDIGLVLSNSSEYHFIVISEKGILDCGRIYDYDNSNVVGMFTTDVDGNGKEELFVIQDNVAVEKRAIAFEILQHNNQYYRQQVYASGFPTKWHKMLKVGDFNGDKKTDFLTYKNAQNWDVFYSTGDGFQQKTVPIHDLTIDPNNSNVIFQVADFNGDGKSDIKYVNKASAIGVISGKIWYSNGNDFQEEDAISLWNKKRKNLISYGDFNGDGVIDEIVPITDNKLAITNSITNNESFLLRKIADGFNNFTELEYGSLADSYLNSRTLGYGPPRYSILEFQMPISLVSKVKSSNPNGGLNEAEYFYNTMYFSREKGILGFKEFYTYNPQTEYTTCQISEPFYNLDFPIVLPKKTVVFKGRDNFVPPPSDIFSYSEPDIELVKLSNQRYWLKNNGSHSYASLNQLHTKVKNTIDNNGNLTYSQTSIGSGVYSTTKEITNIYIQKNTWIPAHLKESTTTVTRKNEDAISRTQQFNYDTKGRLIQKIADVGTTKETTITYQPDVFGNTTQTTLSATGLSNRVTKSIYDDKGRYILQSINIQNQATKYTYEPPFDAPKSSESIEGYITKYEYDAFGNKTKTTLPNSSESENKLEWDIQQGSNLTYDNQLTSYKIKTTTTGEPTSTTWYNKAGLQVKTKMEGFSNEIYSASVYDNLGRVIQETENYYEGETPKIRTTIYDSYGRIVSSGIDNITQTNTYSFGQETNKTVTTSPDGNSKYTIKDANGLIVEASDNGGVMKYSYYSDGNLRSIELDGVEMITMKYDILGNKTETNDKNGGLYKYAFNAYSQITNQTNPDNKKTYFTYDTFGRLKTETKPQGEGAVQYNYIPSGNGVNSISEINFNNYNILYEYGDFGRLTAVTETIDGQTFTSKYEYDTNGKILTTEYPAGFKLKNVYTQSGYLEKVTNHDESVTIWEALEQNSKGVINKYKLGNGVTTNTIFDEYGIPKRITAGNIMDLELSFLKNNGNLEFRKDHIKNLTETFSYDNLNRLKTTAVNNINQLNLNYAANGNIKHKSDIGTYVYDPDKINAVTQITQNNQPVIQPQTISYTSFQSPKKISEGDFELDFTYDHSRQRKKIILKQAGNNKLITYYLGNYEKQVDNNGNQTELHYINIQGLNAIYVKTNSASQFHYTYSDHLGSVVAITDQSGTIEEEYNYDAWGRKRNPLNWTYNLAQSTPTLTWYKRGYTGHEQLDEFGLINMNSRLYDPVVARMLSPDNYIQQNDFSQNLNRYSYALNNPLKYSDPSGDFIFTALAAVFAPPLVPVAIGVDMGIWSGGARANNTNNPFKWDYSSGKTWKYMFAGGVVGAGSAWAGNYVNSSDILSKTLSIVSTSFLSTVGTSLYTGGETDVNISFGVSNYNMSQNSWGYLGKKGNSKLQNFGYSMGLFANISDGYSIYKGAYGNKVSDAILVTENDAIGHSALVDKNGNTLVSVGPKPGLEGGWYPEETIFRARGTNKWPSYVNDNMWDLTKATVTNVRIDKINDYVSRNLSGSFNYTLFTNSCALNTSRALNAAGVFNIPLIHPVLTNAQIIARENSYYFGFINYK